MNIPTSSTITVAVAKAAPRVTAIVLALAVVVVLAVHASLITRFNANWDEFYFLSHIHAYQRGELVARLLTFHVHFLGWVTRIDNEVDQVIALRVVMCVCMLVTSAAVAQLGRKLLGTWSSGLFCALVAQSFSLVMFHGASARFDPLIVALLLSAAALLVGTRAVAAGAAGLCCALALLVSIKSALWLPTLVAVPFMTGFTRRRARQIVAFCMTTAVAFALGYALHVWSLAPATLDVSGVTRDGGGAIAIARTMLGGVFHGVPWFPRKEVLDRTLVTDRWFWLLLVVGCLLCIVRRPFALTASNALLLLLAVPLLSITVYRNAYPYYYVTIVPPAALLVGVVVARVEVALAQRVLLRAVVTLALAAPFLVGVFGFERANHGDALTHQRSFIEGVRAVFPQPVPYVDRCAMIANYKKIGPFMSTMALADYRAHKHPVFEELLREQRPQFLVANVESLQLQDVFDPVGKKRSKRHALLDDDVQTLQESFVAHWGALWVAGRALVFDAAGDRSITIHIPGSYVLSLAPSDAAVLVDGVEHHAGDVVKLAGPHTIAVDRAAHLTFKTAQALAPPARAAETRNLFGAQKPR